MFLARTLVSWRLNQTKPITNPWLTSTTKPNICTSPAGDRSCPRGTSRPRLSGPAVTLSLSSDLDSLLLIHEQQSRLISDDSCGLKRTVVSSTEESKSFRVKLCWVSVYQRSPAGTMSGHFLHFLTKQESSQSYWNFTATKLWTSDLQTDPRPAALRTHGLAVCSSINETNRSIEKIKQSFWCSTVTFHVKKSVEKCPVSPPEVSVFLFLQNVWVLYRHLNATLSFTKKTFSLISCIL